MDDHYVLSDDIKRKIDEFSDADAKYKAELTEFEQEYSIELERLDRLREERNIKLDDAVRTLRTEAEVVPHTTTKRLCYGVFIAQKRLTEFYRLERFVALAQQYGMYKRLLTAGILKQEIVLTKSFNETQSYLLEQGIVGLFEEAEDVRPTSAPAITRPGIVPAFGSEIKDG